MFRRHIRRVILWVFSVVLLGLVAVPLIQQNVQKLAAERHWDEFLSSRYSRWSADVGTLAQHSWFWLTLGFFAGGVGVGWLLEYLHSSHDAQEPPLTPTAATKAEIKLRLFADGAMPRTMPTEIRSENIPYWCAIYSSSAALRNPSDGTLLLSIPSHWSVFLLFDRETDYKEMVARYYCETGETPRIHVIQQSRRHAALSIEGLTSSGELDIYVKP